MRCSWQVASCDMASERTCSPQTRWDAPVTTLRWVKSPSLTNSSQTIDSSYDNSPSRHRLENKPLWRSESGRGPGGEAWFMSPSRKRGTVAHMLQTAFLPHQSASPCLPVALRLSSLQCLFACLLTAGMGSNDKPPRTSISLRSTFHWLCWMVRS